MTSSRGINMETTQLEHCFLFVVDFRKSGIQLLSFTFMQCHQASSSSELQRILQGVLRRHCCYFYNNDILIAYSTMQYIIANKALAPVGDYDSIVSISQRTAAASYRSTTTAIRAISLLLQEVIYSCLSIKRDL